MKMQAKLSEKTILDLIRKNWCEVSGTLADRVYSSDLLKISDDQQTKSGHLSNLEKSLELTS